MSLSTSEIDMSQRLKDIHDNLKSEKAKRRDLKTIVKDALTNSHRYNEALEQLEQAKLKVQGIKAAIMSDLKSELESIDKCTHEIKAFQELLSDVALSELMKGETVEIDDPDVEHILNPVFKVSFKPQGKLKH